MVVEVTEDDALLQADQALGQIWKDLRHDLAASIRRSKGDAAKVMKGKLTYQVAYSPAAERMEVTFSLSSSAQDACPRLALIFQATQLEMLSEAEEEAA